MLLRVQLINGSIGSDNGLALNSRQAIIWSNVAMLYWHIYASFSLNEVNSPIRSAWGLLMAWYLYGTRTSANSKLMKLDYKSWLMIGTFLYHCNIYTSIEAWIWGCRADSRFASSQWEMPLFCNNVSHWLGASLESALGCVEGVI